MKVKSGCFTFSMIIIYFGILCQYMGVIILNKNDDLSKVLKDSISSTEWQWNLIFFKKNNRNQNIDVSLYKVTMEETSLIVDKIVNFFINKTLQEMEIKDYSPSNSKGIIDKVNISDISPIETFFSQIKSVTNSTHNFNKDVTEKITGYYFWGENPSTGENIYLLKKTNPIKNYKSTMAFLRDENYIKKVRDDLINIYLNVDCIFTVSNCYLITEGMDRFFGLETYFINNAKEKLNYMKDNGFDQIATDIPKIEAVSLKPRTSKSFVTFSVKNFDRLHSMSDKERKHFFDRHYLHYDEKGRFTPNTNKDVQIFVQYLCDETACDYDGITVEVKNKKQIDH